MVKEGIILGHRISRKGIEVDKAKIEIVEKVPPPASEKGIRSFLRPCGFLQEVHQRFLYNIKTSFEPIDAWIPILY